MLRLPAPTVRLRLTLLYGALFLVSGALLLAITYFLFRSATGINLIVVPTGTSQGAAGPDRLQHLLEDPAVARYVREAAASRVATWRKPTPPNCTSCSSSPGSRWRS